MHTFRHFQIHMQNPHAQTVLWHSEMCSSEVHAMWCTFCLPPLHSSMDFQAVSNTHSLTQPGLLIACFTSTMRQRISNEAVQSWGAEDDITVMWGVKLQEELAWMACPPRWTFPPTIPSTFPHTYPHSWKKIKLACADAHKNRATFYQSADGESCIGQKGLGVGSRGLTTQQLFDFLQPDGVSACLFLGVMMMIVMTALR